MATIDNTLHAFPGDVPTRYSLARPSVIGHCGQQQQNSHSNDQRVFHGGTTEVNKRANWIEYTTGSTIETINKLRVR